MKRVSHLPANATLEPATACISLNAWMRFSDSLCVLRMVHKAVRCTYLNAAAALHLLDCRLASHRTRFIEELREACSTTLFFICRQQLSPASQHCIHIQLDFSSQQN